MRGERKAARKGGGGEYSMQGREYTLRIRAHLTLFLFCAEGEVFVYRAAVGLIKLCQSQLCKMDFEDAVTLLRHLSQEVRKQRTKKKKAGNRKETKIDTLFFADQR